MILSLIFIVLAAVLNAVMDSVEYETAYSRSIFSKYNPKWWLKTTSWEYVKFLPFTKYRPDAWHLAKSGMIVFLCLAIVFFSTKGILLIDFLILGAVWNTVFNIFYNRIFRL